MRKSESDTLPSKSEVLAHWAADIHRYVEDFDERYPKCWACSLDWGGRLELKSKKPNRASVAKRWEEAPLQRCHIVPRSMGGDDSCGNLFLMCRECHDLAPNTPFREVFFKWTTSQSHLGREWSRNQAESRFWGIDDSNADEWTKVLNSPEFKQWANDKAGLHRPQSGYSGMGKRLTPATLMGLIWWWKELKAKGDVPGAQLGAKGSDQDGGTT